MPARKRVQRESVSTKQIPDVPPASQPEDNPSSVGRKRAQKEMPADVEQGPSAYEMQRLVRFSSPPCR